MAILLFYYGLVKRGKFKRNIKIALKPIKSKAGGIYAVNLIYKINYNI